MNTQEIQTLFTYNDWANRRILAAVRGLEAQDSSGIFGPAIAPCEERLYTSYGPNGCGCSDGKASRPSGCLSPESSPTRQPSKQLGQLSRVTSKPSSTTLPM